MPSTFQYELRVRYSEVDSQGIVFNANYLNYLDVAITEYFRYINMPYLEFIQKFQIDFHVVHVSIDYKYPAKFDDLIQIQLSPEYSKAKIFWNFQIKKDKTLLTSGEIVYVAVNLESGKIEKISFSMIEALRLLERSREPKP